MNKKQIKQLIEQKKGLDETLDLIYKSARFHYQRILEIEIEMRALEPFLYISEIQDAYNQKMSSVQLHVTKIDQEEKHLTELLKQKESFDNKCNKLIAKMLYKRYTKNNLLSAAYENNT